MKKIKITYWTTTVIISLMMAFSAYAYLTLPEMKQGFDHLGFPDYFRIELAFAKMIGVGVLLAPVTNRLKEWAYAGFGIVLISAFIAHLASGEPVASSLAPLITLGLLMVSYFTYQKMLKVADLKFILNK